jgi:serine protease Do
VVSKLDALKVASLFEDIPQNVNFAIKASAAARFLDANSIAYESGQPGAKLALADVAERAKTFTVGLACGR